MTRFASGRCIVWTSARSIFWTIPFQPWVRQSRQGFVRPLIGMASSDWLCVYVILCGSLYLSDLHVARRLFDDAIAGLLAKKTRLLVLNSHYHLLQHAHKVTSLAGSQAQAQARLCLV